MNMPQRHPDRLEEVRIDSPAAAVTDPKPTGLMVHAHAAAEFALATGRADTVAGSDATATTQAIPQLGVEAQPCDCVQKSEHAGISMRINVIARLTQGTMTRLIVLGELCE